MTGRDGRGDDSDWIFHADPGTLPTDRLPGREDIARATSPLAPTGPIPVVPGPSGDPAAGADASADADARASSADPTQAADPTRTADPATAGLGGASPAGSPSYARSGTTPSAPDDPRTPVLSLPSRFAALSWWDAVRDIVALIALLTACTVPYTQAEIGPWLLAPRIAIGIAVAALIAVHLLRWLPEQPRLSLVRRLRVIGMIPALIVAVGTIGADLALSIPVLFAPLPDGPPVGIGVGVALMLLGAGLGIEPRRHEGFIPGERARSRTRCLLLVLAGVAAALTLLALVMIIGRVATTGWAYSVRVLADAFLSAVVLGIVLRAGLRRERSRYVFAVAAVAGLIAGALADDALRLQFALPRSAATGLVYLPLLFAVFAVMVSRSFVRTMPLSFRRADWIVYAVRTLEFSRRIHLAALIACVLMAFAAAGGVGRGMPMLYVIDAVLAGIFVVLSSVGRRSLLERSALSARAGAVVAAVVMVLLGFLDVIVNSVASGAGAGLVTGGVALAVGIAVALMLTVPAPVRDQYGAPDIVRMFDDFRRRDTDARSILARVPDVRSEMTARKPFPGSAPRP